ncbi:MAG: hypothetical protein ABIK37_01850, partial [candidate division WOR-3 bacterium]
APFGSSLVALRLMVFVCALAGLLAFWRLWLRARRETGSPGSTTLPALFLLASYPYFLSLSGLFMSEPPALALCLASMLCYLNWRRGRSWTMLALTLLAATAAIYIRQYSLFLPAAYAVGELAAPAGRRGSWLLMLLPVVAFLPLVLFWHGLVPAGLQFRHYPGLALTNLSSILIWTGFVCLPWAMLYLFRLRRFNPWLLIALTAVPLVLIAPLPGAGIVRSLLAVLPDPLPGIAAVLLALAGGVALVLVCSRLSATCVTARTSALSVLFLLLILAFGGPTLYERHFLPVVPLLLLAFSETIRPLPALVWGLVVQLPLAIVQIARLTGRV